MRRTTQWAFFTSMNQQPAWRSMVEPVADGAGVASAADETAEESEPLPRSAREPRRDRVEFM